MEQQPSLERQKDFIVESSSLLNKSVKMAIMNVVMMEIGDQVVTRKIPANEVHIDLDVIGKQNPGVILHIYNMVKARRQSLNQQITK